VLAVDHDLEHGVGRDVVELSNDANRVERAVEPASCRSLHGNAT
jgi:hypothetical protein